MAAITKYKKMHKTVAYTINDCITQLITISEYLFCITNDRGYVPYHQVCDKSNTASVTGGTGTVYLLGKLSSSLIINRIPVARSLFFYAMFFFPHYLS
jgi:hypothetical protein